MKITEKLKGKRKKGMLKFKYPYGLINWHGETKGNRSDQKIQGSHKVDKSMHQLMEYTAIVNVSNQSITLLQMSQAVKQ